MPSPGGEFRGKRDTYSNRTGIREAFLHCRGPVRPDLYAPNKANCLRFRAENANGQKNKANSGRQEAGDGRPEENGDVPREQLCKAKPIFRVLRLETRIGGKAKPIEANFVWENILATVYHPEPRRGRPPCLPAPATAIGCLAVEPGQLRGAPRQEQTAPGRPSKDTKKRSQTSPLCGSRKKLLQKARASL